MRGTVTAFDDGKGVGFIRGQDGREYLVEYTEIRGSTDALAVNAEVDFEPVETSSGPQAAEVHTVEQ